jgi:DNA-binding GntR family transcriptional regulator
MRTKKLVIKKQKNDEQKKRYTDDLVAKKLSGQWSLTEKITLKIVRSGADRINFKILEMLPSNINAIMKEFNLTKVPINVRVNELEKVGLVDRFKGTGIVVLTDFGKFFIDTIKSYEELVFKYWIRQLIENEKGL